MAIAIIGPPERAAVAACLLHAASHVYDTTGTVLPPTPGDDPRHVVMFGNVRVVYTHTLAPCRKRLGCSHLFHHLTVSVSTPGKYPHPAVVQEIALEFGMGLPWSASGVHETERCVVVLKEIDPKGHA